MYGNIYDDEERFQRQAVFPRLMCTHAEDFSFANTAFNRDVVKAGTGRRLVAWVERLGNEVSGRFIPE